MSTHTTTQQDMEAFVKCAIADRLRAHNSKIAKADKHLNRVLLRPLADLVAGYIWAVPRPIAPNLVDLIWRQEFTASDDGCSINMSIDTYLHDDCCLPCPTLMFDIVFKDVKTEHRHTIDALVNIITMTSPREIVTDIRDVLGDQVEGGPPPKWYKPKIGKLLRRISEQVRAAAGTTHSTTVRSWAEGE